MGGGEKAVIVGGADATKEKKAIWGPKSEKAHKKSLGGVIGGGGGGGGDR